MQNWQNELSSLSNKQLLLSPEQILQRDNYHAQRHTHQSDLFQIVEDNYVIMVAGFCLKETKKMTYVCSAA
jgi:hypothetical protein